MLGLPVLGDAVEFAVQKESAEPKVVLYVEDDPVNVILMQAIFEQRPGLSLVVALDGQQALEIATTLRPALLLLDLRLPDCNGADLLPVLQRKPGYAGLNAVAVTAEPHYRVARTGFCELWAKPLNIAHTLERLDLLVAA